jgi:AcrR family transcriptional regulator
LRADAQRNRRLLLDAACRVFIDVGIDAPLEAIARQANVGIATLYRHFPRRATLVNAVAADIMQRTRAEAVAALAEEADAFTALRRYMHRALDVCAPAVMPLVDETVRNDPEVKALLDSTAAAQSALIKKAARQGSLRGGVQFADVGLVLARFSRPIGGGFDPELEASLAHRHIDVFIDGLRDNGRPPLPSLGVTLQKLRGMQRRKDAATSTARRR